MRKAKEKSVLNSAGQQMLSFKSRENTPEAQIEILEYRKKIEDLIDELQLKDSLNQALQNNYDGISLAYKNSSSKSAEWMTKISSLENEINSLRREKSSVESQKLKMHKELEKTTEELAKFCRTVEEYRTCKLENQTTKSLLEKKVYAT